MKSLPALIVLAAGRGSRYAGPRHKLAEELAGASVLGHTLGNALASGLPVVVVTTPAFEQEAARHVAGRDIVVLGALGGVAPGGMGDSIAAGVAARSSAPGWLMLPADMPLVRPATLQQVAAALAHHPIAYAQHRGQRGHPVGFGEELFSDLVRMTGEHGARRLLARFPACAVETDDAGVLMDVDTEADLARLRAHVAAAEDHLAD